MYYCNKLKTIMLIFEILFSISLVCILFILGKRLQRSNHQPLKIHTFDGSDSPYHPSVKYFKDGYGGYEYIMSETPFYLSLPSVGDNYRDQYECPSIHFSHDGIHWENIIENPIDNLTEDEIIARDYFSDPDLVETPDGLECWYRVNRRYGKESNQENIVLLRKKTKDGIHWGEREIIADLQNKDKGKGLGNVVISPSVLFENDKYKCWFVDNIHLHKENLCYSESLDDTRTWSDKQIVKLKGLDIIPWHLHILRDGDVLWLTLYDHKNITLWKGRSETEFEYVKTLIIPSSVYGSFYSHNTYRACLLKLPDSRYRLYFSADDMFKSYIGVAEGDTPDTMEIVSVDGKKHTTLVNGLWMMIKTKFYVWTNKLLYYIRRIFDMLVGFFS